MQVNVAKAVLAEITRGELAEEETMRNRMVLMSAIAAAAILASAAQSKATPLGTATAAVPSGTLSDEASNVIDVQGRRGGGGGRGVAAGGRRGGGGYRGGGGGRGIGTGIAIGTAIGVIGGMIAADQAQRQDAVGYCMQRFQSYDPSSGTYVGFDGLRHPCP
jgi:hypothetical protein